MYTKIQIAAIKSTANENICLILEALDIQYSERYQYIVGRCPIHDGNNDGAFSWHLQMGIYRCFTKSCQDKWGIDVFGLVRGVRKCDFLTAVGIVEKILSRKNIVVTKTSISVEENKKWLSKQEREPVTYDESLLDRLVYHPYLETRGFSRKIVEDYQIGVSNSKYGKMSNRLIIPIRNIEGCLVGFSGRTLFEDWKERGVSKWEHSKGFVKSQNLFNIDRASSYIQDSGTAILVEGPFDVLRLEEAGIHNSVALMGRELSNRQVTILMTACATDVVLSLDNDIAGKTGAEKAKSLLSSFFRVKTVNVEGVKDVGDASKELILSAFGGA